MRIHPSQQDEHSCREHEKVAHDSNDATRARQREALHCTARVACGTGHEPHTGARGTCFTYTFIMMYAGIYARVRPNEDGVLRVTSTLNAGEQTTFEMKMVRQNTRHSASTYRCVADAHMLLVASVVLSVFPVLFLVCVVGCSFAVGGGCPW